MPRTRKKQYRINPHYNHAYAVCQVPCLVIQEQPIPKGSWWDVVHVIGDPTLQSTRTTATHIIAALKETSA